MVEPTTSRLIGSLLFLILAHNFIPLITASHDPKLVGVTIDGERYSARDDRRPALYTVDFGDCLGASLLNVTRFDAAYYKDNMTMLFQLQGETALVKEDVMMSIAVHAYGETQFELTFNPCNANIWSACPMRSNISIEAAGIIPVSPMDVAGVPDIALSIPDFEGQALLRIFSNRTQAQIGCFAAQIINGNTFRHNAEVGTILGSFTAIAMVASFATAIYGEDIVEIRKHYTNSCSVVTIFAVWHHIYFSGALSMNWPSVLVAFWSNYAWTAGMIYSEQMQNSINDFMGANMRNLSQVGAAGQEPRYPNLAGEYNVSRIYREPSNSNGTKIILPHFKRDFGISATSGFRFEGQPVKPGLSLPGNYSGFAGTLSQDNIPISNAFLTSFFWFLILIAGLLVLLVLYRGFLEVGVRINLIAQNHLRLFRHRFGRYTALTTLRTIIASFFMVIFLSMVQLTYVRSPGPVAIAIFAFLMLVVGLGGAVCFTCYSLITSGYITICHDHLNIVKARRWRILPWYRISRQSTTPNVEDMIYLASLPIWTISLSSRGKSIHSDQHQVTSFGWLTARYRRTRWWFFAIWLIYDFIRASFLAGTCDRPFLQVLGLLTIEIVAFALFCYLRPFEGQQLNVLCVYFLGISKIATAALSATFDARFSLSRMLTTVIALVIIVIQGTLTIVVFIMIAVSVVTSYMSIMRNRAEIWPVSWNRMRENYLRHLELRSEDIPGFSPNRSEDSTAQGEKLHAGSYFAVNHVRRVPKIDDDEFLQDITPSISPESPESYRYSSKDWRSSATSLPPAARLIRPSWHSQEFQASYRYEPSTPSPIRKIYSRDEGLIRTPRRMRSEASLRESSQDGIQIIRNV